MVFITIGEIIDIIIMVFAIGYIFSDYFGKKPHGGDGYDPLAFYSKQSLWENVKNAAIIAAPAVVIHELAHKFVAMGFGAIAVLHAPYTMYAAVIVMKLLRFPLLFFVGGYVSHTALPPLQSALVSLAGPLTNILVWLAIRYLVSGKIMRKYGHILAPMARINMFLGIFNMIPFPGFDGYNFFNSLFRVFF